MGIVRPVMKVFPQAWLFFVPFIVMTAFTVLNLFIGIIVDAMQSHATERQAEADVRAALERQGADDRAAILEELRTLRAKIAALAPVRAGSEGPGPQLLPGA